MRFSKGHGTENDFVVIGPGELDELTAAQARALCDRRTGIGGDGVLRVVPGEAGYVMDYRNADGSLAETCGNGLRVFARFLVDTGLVPTGQVDVATRSGVRQVDVPADGSEITVDMGAPDRLDDAQVSVGDRSWKASGWSMGNPHLVVTDAGPLDRLDLTIAPAVDPASAYPDGVNVELVEPVAAGQLRLRVHERGVGETRSCGSGVCAAAVAVMDVAGERSTYLVEVPGGRLRVRWRDDDHVLLTGPAVIVATGEVDLPALLTQAE